MNTQSGGLKKLNVLECELSWLRPCVSAHHLSMAFVDLAIGGGYHINRKASDPFVQRRRLAAQECNLRLRDRKRMSK